MLRSLATAYGFPLLDARGVYCRGNRSLAIASVTGYEPYFAGHFSWRYPTLPGIMSLNFAVQTCIRAFALNGEGVVAANFEWVEKVDLNRIADRPLVFVARITRVKDNAYQTSVVLVTANHDREICNGSVTLGPSREDPNLVRVKAVYAPGAENRKQVVNGYLPHRYPISLTDEVLELRSGYVKAAHIVPEGVEAEPLAITVEAAAQVGALAYYAGLPMLERPYYLPLLRKVSIRSWNPAIGGDLLLIESGRVLHKGEGFRAPMTAKVNGSVILDCSFSFYPQRVRM